ncbi:MAG: lytic transglycosylase domain-containing protein, partial [Rhodoferax sp.]|nr:lytic transglycosylase domain-containing protein [Rhodoferax sp.]
MLLLALTVSTPSISAEKVKKTSSNKESRISAFEITEGDRTFIELREAAKRNDVARAQTLAASLSNYPYEDYVAYFRIKPQLFDSAGAARADSNADSQVMAFLNQYQGTALADRMRNDWLLVLGKRKDWSRFDAEYPKFFLDDDTQVKCYSLQSKLAQGENPTKV